MKASKRGFKITSGKGFHITFDNGYTVSVQFGPYSYCDHYGEENAGSDEACGKARRFTARNMQQPLR